MTKFIVFPILRKIVGKMSKLEHNTLQMQGILQDVNIFQIKPYLGCSRFNSTNDKLDQLSYSIKQKGLLHPIIVRTKAENFEIVAGNRRYNACKSLGWRKITCHIIELDDREAFEASLIENIQRKTLNPIDEAYAFKRYVSDFGWGGVTDLAIKIGKSVSYITKRIKLLNLSPDILNSILNSKMPVSIAEELYSIKDNKKQKQLSQMIASRHLSFRKARKLIEENVSSCNDATSFGSVYQNNKTAYDKHEKAQRLFDKSIIALRIAMIRLGEVIEGTQNNWITYEILMQHKNMLHSQIDLLIRQKMKIPDNDYCI
jgi:ParB family transcriptional regulator, chromosome partitioning protein